MPPDGVAAPAAAPASAESATPTSAAPEAAPAPAGAKPKSGSPELARWHGQRAQAILAKQEADRTAEPIEPTGAPPKDPTTGRFLKRGKAKTRADAGPDGAHNSVEPGATPGPATKEPKPKTEGQVPDSLAAVRRLFNEGKLEEAFERAFGRLPGEDLGGKGWGAWRAESKRMRAEVEAKSRQVDQREQQLRQIHQELSAEFRPMHEARQALKEGDLDKAFQLFAGTDFNTFSRNYLRQSTSPSVGKDPAFQTLQRQLEEMRRENHEYRQREQETAKQAEARRVEQEFMADLVGELEASDDPRVAKAAKKRGFLNKVIEIERQHWDPANEWTLPHAEAAQMAIEELANEFGEWGDVFGGSRASSPEPRGETRAQPARAATPARPTGKPVTTLSQKEAAEAATEPKLKGKALVEKYVRMANAQFLKETNGIG